jgi:phosphatidate cytidylyltransferase
MCLFFFRYYGGMITVLWLLLIIWATDIAAYELGRRIGKHKLAPAISPHKTVEGALAGFFAALLLGGGYALLFMDINLISAILLPPLISVLGQVGDLLESSVKRLAGVKDSGKLFPGHGGVLDRFDSILLAAPVMCLLLLVL